MARKPPVFDTNDPTQKVEVMQVDPVKARQRLRRVKTETKPAATTADILEAGFSYSGQEDELDPPQASSLPATAKTVSFSMGLAERICERISLGEALQEICKGDDMPTVAQVHRWLRRYARFEELYEQARLLQADYLADEMLVLVKEIRANPTKSSALRAAADLLAKQAEWRNVRKYGSKIDMNITERPKSPDEIRAEIERLRTELGVPTGRIARIK